MAFRNPPEAAQGSSNRVLQLVLLGLTLVIVLAAVTWIELPGSVPRVFDYSEPSTKLHPPASWFAVGLVHRRELVPGELPEDARSYVELHALKTRIAIFYGSAAALIVLVGFAFGAGRRSSPP